MRQRPTLTWLDPDDPFPDPATAWPLGSDAPGLLAAGADLSPTRLIQAYSQGIFPWYSDDQPIWWWTTHPRMVLHPDAFKWRQEIRKKARRWRREQRLDIRFNHDFTDVMRCCAQASRAGQTGTWIGNDMIQAYTRLHHMGHAQSVTAWLDGQLVGGLYVVLLGRMIYGESMFSHVSGGSKLALGALVAWAREHRLPLIDCQQQTLHLQGLGGQAMDRPSFLTQVASLVKMSRPAWHFEPHCWTHIDPGIA